MFRILICLHLPFLHLRRLYFCRSWLRKYARKKFITTPTLPRWEIRDALDLSPKVVFKGSELRTDPRDAAAPMSLSDSLRTIMATGPCGRAGALAWRPLLTPLRAPCASLRDSPSLLTKMGGLDPKILKWAHTCLHHLAQEDQWQCWWRCDDGHAYGAVTTARSCAECPMHVFSPNGHKNPTESEQWPVFQGRRWRWERLTLVFRVTQLVRKWAGSEGAQSSLISEPMLFTRLPCCQSGGEGWLPDLVQGWWRVRQPVMSRSLSSLSVLPKACLILSWPFGCCWVMMQIFLLLFLVSWHHLLCIFFRTGFLLLSDKADPKSFRYFLWASWFFLPPLGSSAKLKLLMISHTR